MHICKSMFSQVPNDKHPKFGENSLRSSNRLLVCEFESICKGNNHEVFRHTKSTVGHKIQGK